MNPTSMPVSSETSKAFYTPFQVRLASFIGGPFAAIYTLYLNFKNMELEHEARVTLYGGVVFVVVLLAILPFLPEKFPNLIIPLIYSLIAGSIASSKQLSKEKILTSESYVRCSAWNVVIVCLVSLVSFSAICLVEFTCIQLF